MTRQEIFADIDTRLDQLTPREISDYTVMLASHLSTMATDMAKTEREYYRLWNANLLQAEGVKSKADNASKASLQYQRMVEVKTQFEATVEMIHALKKRLNVLYDEMHGNA